MSSADSRTTEDDELAELARLATVGRLTAGALHEIANPLIALLGTAELALDDVEGGSRAADRLGLVLRTGSEIAEIIRALQGFGRERLAPDEDLSLLGTVGEALALVRRLSAVRDVEISERYGEDCTVRAGPGRLKHLLVALLLDAQAAHPHGGEFELAAGAEADRAVVTVGDARPAGLALKALQHSASELGGELVVAGAAARLAIPAI